MFWKKSFATTVAAFLQTVGPSCRLTNSVTALKTELEHWKNRHHQTHDGRGVASSLTIVINVVTPQHKPHAHTIQQQWYDRKWLCQTHKKLVRFLYNVQPENGTVSDTASVNHWMELKAPTRKNWFHIDEVQHMGVQPLCGALRQQGLNTIKLAYNWHWLARVNSIHL